jgi:radical SAM superfamily enzyme YgiQ (UPF0313 family)
MKVLFVITNINGTYGDAYSFGLASIASIARDKGWDYDYAVLNTREELDGFCHRIPQRPPRIVAYTAVSSQFGFVKEISARLKSACPGGIIQICGGIHPTIFPECVLETPALDGIFIGESDFAFADFLDRVSGGRSFLDVKNFAFVDDGALRKNPLYPLLESLDSLPFPERDKYGYERFIEKENYALFMFSRGCPFGCSYCSNHAIARVYGRPFNKPRYRSPKRCIEEIQDLSRRYQFDRVFVGDDTFGLDRHWMRKFCDIYAREIRRPMACLLRVNTVDEELLENLKRAGCVHVSCGVESGNEKIRNEVMKRNVSEQQIVNAYALFKRFGMTANAINMIGLPYETEDMIRDTIRLNRRIRPDSSGVNIFYPYRGTELGDHCFTHGLVDEVLYAGFSSERRDSVLNFPPEFKTRLRFYHAYWEPLVFAWRPIRLARLMLPKFMHNKFPTVWKRVKKLRRAIHSVIARPIFRINDAIQNKF